MYPSRSTHIGKSLEGRVSPKVAWHHARSIGLPYGGSLLHGTQLPRERRELGHLEPDHRQSPECAEAAVRKRAHHPHDPFGDARVPRRAPARVARRDRRHQPRGRRPDGRPRLASERARRRHLLPAADRTLRAPTTTAQIDHRLAQDLLDRFVAAGAQMSSSATRRGFAGHAESSFRGRATSTTCTSAFRPAARPPSYSALS